MPQSTKHEQISATVCFEILKFYISVLFFNFMQQESVGDDGAWSVPHLIEFGASCGSAEMLLKSRQANENKPVIHTHDRFGNRRFSHICPNTP